MFGWLVLITMIVLAFSLLVYGLGLPIDIFNNEDPGKRLGG